MTVRSDQQPEPGSSTSSDPRPGVPRHVGSSAAGGGYRAPTFETSSGDYTVRLTRGPDERRAAQRVRFEVFHLELGEGLAESTAQGFDEDPFDDWCDHLVLIDRRSDRIVGTYRLQTYDRAAEGRGLYCGQEFAVEMLPDHYLQHSVELGRACILAQHRQGNALFALWRGIAQYMTATSKRYLFGCCSLTGTTPLPGRIAERWLVENGKAHDELFVPVRPGYACPEAEVSEDEVKAFKLPKLFGTYLRYGALNCSPPAIDHAFGTTDFLVLLDVDAIDPRMRALFFGG